jgi:(1->4)-alpha-D-glucan 1-alpha-D-glucosylmutase
MSSLRIPVATYRLQFNREFTFNEALERLGYLEALGITDLYASPLLQSRRGSGHGYDVTDSTRIDTDPGSEADFDTLQAGLRQRGMGFILDTVPNHMAASGENPWWTDVLENGPGSAYATYFDIDWHPDSRALDNKVLLPWLGNPYGKVLENQELSLAYEDGSFFLKYRQERFPLAPKSYRRVLKHRLDDLKESLGEDSPYYQEYQGILASLNALPERQSLPAEAAGERRLQAEGIKERLRNLYNAAPEVAAFINGNMESFRGVKGDAGSFRPLDRLLSEQAYVLAFWQNPNEVINYRRFFTITDLVGLRVEDLLVFEATQNVILRLIERGIITGLRIDHVDGLRDPLAYLQRLQERIGRSGDQEGFYVVVEKITAASEGLPDEWPVQGTTGYDFLNVLNRLFVDPQGAPAIEEAYQRFIGRRVRYEDVMYQKKKLVMQTLLAVEVRSLARQLAILAQQDRYARDLPHPDLAQALIETTACLHVYRTYIRNLEVPEDSVRYIEQAVAEARRRCPHDSPACFDFVREVLLVREGDHLFPEQREARLGFVMRWQQFTSPVMAKGVEDTSLYVYNALLSLNEVGGDPRPVAPDSPDFDAFVRGRARKWPYSLNATATHDTKRTEDVRARINVLSEIPREWSRRLNRWSRLNASKKKEIEGQLVPDRNEEAFLYQTLAGAWPLDSAAMPELRPRLKEYLIKAIREAMVHTRWSLPNPEHEGAVTGFLDSVLCHESSEAFRKDFLKFQKKVAWFGMLNGLAQVLLKIVCPGVPDFYQGSELWDLRLVDPDNRGLVDFDRRAALLDGLRKAGPDPKPAFIRRLWRDWSDGRIKLYVIWKALNLRRQHPRLFLDGDYVRLEARGERADQVVALVRTYGSERVLAVVPRWLARAQAPRSSQGWRRFWEGTELRLPPESPAEWWNVLTGERTVCSSDRRRPSMRLDQALGSFPVALFLCKHDKSSPFETSNRL